MDDRPACEFIKPDGNRCCAKARPGRTLCFAHDPKLKDKRDAARRAGGVASARKAAVLPPDTADLCLVTVGDVCTMLAGTINQARRGELDVKIANCLGYLGSVLLKALEGSELERQFAELKADMESIRHGDKHLEETSSQPAGSGRSAT
jgi:hypothetical protein